MQCSQCSSTEAEPAYYVDTALDNIEAESNEGRTLMALCSGCAVPVCGHCQRELLFDCAVPLRERPPCLQVGQVVMPQQCAFALACEDQCAVCGAYQFQGVLHQLNGEYHCVACLRQKGLAACYLASCRAVFLVAVDSGDTTVPVREGSCGMCPQCAAWFNDGTDLFR